MFRLEEEKNSRGTVMSGSAIRGWQGSERFFMLPAVTLIASSFVLGMSDFVVVGILSDIAHGLRVSEVTVGNLVSRFATHLTLIGVFLAGNILCALAPNYAVLPHYSHMAKVGFLPQFRLFFDRRIQLGVLAVVFGAAATYVFYTYLTPIMRDEVHVPEQYLSVGLVIFGAACLWSNLYGGKLADRGRGVEPLTHIRPIYCAHAVLMASLIVTHWVPVYGALLLVVLGMFMYLQNSASQVLYMDVASQSHPGSLNLAASLNSMSFNIGIAVGSAVGGLVNAHLGLMWLGPVGAIFLLCAVGTTTLLRPFAARERDFYAKQQA